jgi:hypothetical protein
LSERARAMRAIPAKRCSLHRRTDPAGCGFTITLLSGGRRYNARPLAFRQDASRGAMWGQGERLCSPQECEAPWETMCVPGASSVRLSALWRTGASHRCRVWPWLSGHLPLSCHRGHHASPERGCLTLQSLALVPSIHSQAKAPHPCGYPPSRYPQQAYLTGISGGHPPWPGDIPRLSLSVRRQRHSQYVDGCRHGRV